MLNWKRNINRIKKMGLPLALGILTCFCISFANKQYHRQPCQGIDIHLEKGNHFLDEGDIRNIILKQEGHTIKGRPLTGINTNAIENNLRKNPYIKKAQAYTDLHGNIHIDISQPKPIIRIMNPAMQHYYLDKNGKHIPLSPEYTAYVPVATAAYFDIHGNRDSILRALDSSLYIFARYLDSNKFAYSLTGQIIINPHNEFSIIPRLGNFVIDLGNVNDLDNKFLRLETFYRITLPEVGWKKYKKITLKYRNQIIAKY